MCVARDANRVFGRRLLLVVLERKRHFGLFCKRHKVACKAANTRAGHDRESSRWHTALAALLTVYVHVHKTQLHRPAVKFEERYGGGVGEDFADQFADEFRAFVNELQLVVRGTLNVDSGSWHQFHLLKKT